MSGSYEVLNYQKHNPIVFLYIGVFLVAHTTIPYYNKSLFVIYNYPVTATWLQVCGVAFCLMAWDAVRAKTSNPPKKLSQIMGSPPPRSWIFGPGIFFKIQHLFLPSFLFAAFLTLNNIGLSLVNVLLHLMLKASQTAFTVLLTFLFLPETPTIWAVLLALLSATGAFLLSMASLEGDVDAAALIINISNAFLSPLSIISLRKAVYVLRYGTIDENPHGHMGVIEMTAIKMSMVAIWMIPILLVKETFVAGTTAWEGLTQDFGSDCVAWSLFIGFFFTLLNQSCVVALCHHLEPIAKTVLMDASNIPQLALAFIIGGWTLNVCGCEAMSKCHKPKYPSCPCFTNQLDKFTGDYNYLHYVGYILIFITSIAFSFLKYKNLSVKPPNELGSQLSMN